jgi:hypothetical protein
MVGKARAATHSAMPFEKFEEICEFVDSNANSVWLSPADFPRLRGNFPVPAGRSSAGEFSPPHVKLTARDRTLTTATMLSWRDEDLVSADRNTVL